jgi:hypothetical protein
MLKQDSEETWKSWFAPDDINDSSAKQCKQLSHSKKRFSEGQKLQIHDNHIRVLDSILRFFLLFLRHFTQDVDGSGRPGLYDGTAGADCSNVRFVPPLISD